MTEQEEKSLFGCGLWQGMGQQEAKRLLECLGGEELHYEKNQIVWNMGDPVTACAVVLSGSVRAEAVDAAGEHTLMALHGPGALVGDILMATPEAVSPVYVTAVESTVLMLLPYGKLMGGCGSCCRWHEQLRKNLLSEIAGKYWLQRRRMGYLRESSLRSRILLYLRDRSRDAGSPTFSVGGTREDLADFLCVNRSALSRELGRMKREGLVDFYRDTFRLPEMP